MYTLAITNTPLKFSSLFGANCNFENVRFEVKYHLVVCANLIYLCIDNGYEFSMAYQLQNSMWNAVSGVYPKISKATELPGN